MKLLKKITLVAAILLSTLSAQASVFQVNNIELKFKRFNAQKIRAYAVDVATKRGFEKLLTNIVPQEYDVKGLLESIDLKKVDVVEKLNIVSEVNVKGKYEAKFDILYSEDKIKKILKEKRVPFIQETMGDVLLLAVNQTANQDFLLFEESNVLKDLLFKNLKDSLLIKPVLPKGDLQEITTYNPQNILDANNEDKVLQLAKKYNADKAIVVLLQQNNYQDESLYQVTIKYINFDKLTEESFIVLGQDMKQVAKEIKTKIKTIWQQNNLLEFNKPKRFVAMINTASSLDNLYATIKKLEKMNIVSSVKIKQLTTQYAFIQTDFYGTPQEFLSSTEKAGLKIYQGTDGQWLVERIEN
tara:strand:- start:4478 stop:5545 length:1068 start_codon:yes stop_codon:yes gene_type:complete